MSIYAGDIVEVTGLSRFNFGERGVVVLINRYIYLIYFSHRDDLHSGGRFGKTRGYWWVEPENLMVVKNSPILELEEML
jgi:hypothetical protein